MWYEVRLETKAYCTERVFASTPEEAAAKAIAQCENGLQYWDAIQSENPIATKINPVGGMDEDEYINCFKEIVKYIDEAKTYGIPSAQMLLSMKAFCEDTMMTHKARKGNKKGRNRTEEWKR